VECDDTQCMFWVVSKTFLKHDEIRMLPDTNYAASFFEHVYGHQPAAACRMCLK
jgi:hypothetical protein